MPAPEIPNVLEDTAQAYIDDLCELVHEAECNLPPQDYLTFIEAMRNRLETALQELGEGPRN